MTELPDRPVRAPTPVAAWSPAGVYPEKLARQRVYLDRLRVHHLDLAKRFVSVDDGNMYWTDLLFVTVSARSYSLVDGFLSAFDKWNVIVAAPIVRMQIDNLVRLAYAATVNSDDLAKYMVMGGRLKERKDSKGKLLSDAQLVELAVEAGHGWADDVYTATSGWVHLSPELLHAVVRFEDRSEDEDDAHLVAGFGIPIRREQIPVSALQDLLGAMTQATEEVFGYVEVWESRKGLPLGQARDLRAANGPEGDPGR